MSARPFGTRGRAGLPTGRRGAGAGIRGTVAAAASAGWAGRVRPVSGTAIR
ncbi:hypothetical protein [Amycolatopsis speibonae]|uniref:Uncharacterized protein n=1 Tax=Amycolatopsis speibonae TaxID=1450224 RepID=A0ABV7P8G9_9PSEU